MFSVEMLKLRACASLTPSCPQSSMSSWVEIVEFQKEILFFLSHTQGGTCMSIAVHIGLLLLCQKQLDSDLINKKNTANQSATFTPWDQIVSPCLQLWWMYHFLFAIALQQMPFLNPPKDKLLSELPILLALLQYLGLVFFLNISQKYQF